MEFSLMVIGIFLLACALKRASCLLTRFSLVIDEDFESANNGKSAFLTI